MALGVAVALALACPAGASAAGKVFQFNGPYGCTTNSGADRCATGRGLRGASGIAVSPGGSNLYVASNDASSVTTFFRDRRNGRIVQRPGLGGCTSHTGAGRCTTGRGLFGAFAVAVSPDGANVYVATVGGVAVFARDKGNGALTQLGGARGCVNVDGSDGCATGRGLALAADVEVSPDGKSVYITATTSDAIAAFARDPETGELSQLPGAAGCTSLAGTEGCATAGRGLDGAHALALSPSGSHVFVTGTESEAVVSFVRDPDSGALAPLAGAGGCLSAAGDLGCEPARGLGSPNGIAVSVDGASLYVASSGSDALAALSVEPGGTMRQLSGRRGCWSRHGEEGCASAAPLDGAFAVAVSSDDRNVYLATQRALVGFQRRAREPRLGALERVDCTSQGGKFGCPTGRALEGASAVALDARGRHLYVAAEGSGGVASFARDPQQGRVRVRLRGEPSGCTRRAFSLRARVRSRLPLRAAAVFLNGRRQGRARDADGDGRFRVDVPKLRRGKYRLKVEATDVTGTRDRQTAKFRSCRPRRG